LVVFDFDYPKQLEHWMMESLQEEEDQREIRRVSISKEMNLSCIVKKSRGTARFMFHLIDANKAHIARTSVVKSS